MTSETIIFLHGYATRGGLQTAKAGFLHDRLSAYAHIDFQAIDFNPTAKDFQYHTIRMVYAMSRRRRHQYQ